MLNALVKIDSAALDLRMPVSRIEDLVDGGAAGESGLLWVFNVASNPRGKIRSLRFFRPELLARGTDKAHEINQLTIEQVIAEILPATRARFPAGEVDQLFQMRRPTRIALADELPGKLDGGRNVYQRTALAEFLQRRWVGSSEGTKSS
jgi:hypothetical protein